MKKFLLLLSLATFSAGAQVAGCNQTSFSPITICYPNSTKVIPQPTSTDIIYLCGPNSIVYDTLTPGGIKFRNVFVNAGGFYHFKSLISNNQVNIYAKAGSTVQIESGSFTTFVFNVYKEAGATITNLSTGTITTTNCLAISGPSINCAAASVNNLSKNNSAINIYPNPLSDKFIINLDKSYENVSLNLINQLGEVVLKNEFAALYQKEISIESFPTGIYYLTLKGKDIFETRKIVLWK